MLKYSISICLFLHLRSHSVLRGISKWKIGLQSRSDHWPSIQMVQSLAESCLTGTRKGKLEIGNHFPYAYISSLNIL